MRKSGNLFLNFVLRAIICVCVWGGGEAVADVIILSPLQNRNGTNIRYIAFPYGYSSYTLSNNYTGTCTKANSYLRFSNAKLNFSNGTASISIQTGNNSECYCQTAMYWSSSAGDCVSCGGNYKGGNDYHKNTSCFCPKGYQNVYNSSTSKYSCNACAAGYYQTTDVSQNTGSSCKKCPPANDGATVTGGGTSETGCYIAKNATFEDLTGNGTYTDNCYYSPN